MYIRCFFSYSEGRSVMSWERVFNNFKVQYRLDEELRRIEHWIDFRNFSNDIVLYLRSPNMLSESLGSGSPNNDTCLETVVRYSDEVERFRNLWQLTK